MPRSIASRVPTTSPAVAPIYDILRDLCGPDWQPVEAWFAHRRPLDVGPFRRFFRTPLRLDAQEYALLFSADCLPHRLPSADPELQSLLQNQLKSLDARHEVDFLGQVRRVLRTSPLTGQNRADQFAAFFSMHTRTLNRRLDACGTGFQELLDASRFDIVQQMLRDTSLEVG
jgi:Arabinose-binding domain of AraC transcription regulator, N-term